jgi:hypothetical protein
LLASRYKIFPLPPAFKTACADTPPTLKFTHKDIVKPGVEFRETGYVM